MADTSFVRTHYYLFDEPIPYNGLLIYPIKLKDFFEFTYYLSCMMIEKNSIKDNPEMAIRAISMPYLEYMYEISDDKNNYIYLFDGLLRMILGKKEDNKFSINYSIDGRTKRVFKDTNGEVYFEINKKKYYSHDFDEIKKILSEQNLIDFPDMTIQKQVRDQIEEARKYKNKINKTKMASLEEQIIALSVYAGWSISDIYAMTYRKFIMSIKRANHMIMDSHYTSATLNGFVKFKDKVVKGWLADIGETEKDKDVTIGIDRVQKNLGLVNGK